MNTQDRITLAVFAALTVMFVAAVWMSRPDDEPGDRPTWHRRPHE